MIHEYYSTTRTNIARLFIGGELSDYIDHMENNKPLYYIINRIFQY